MKPSKADYIKFMDAITFHPSQYSKHIGRPCVHHQTLPHALTSAHSQKCPQKMFTIHQLNHCDKLSDCSHKIEANNQRRRQQARNNLNPVLHLTMISSFNTYGNKETDMRDFCKMINGEKIIHTKSETFCQKCFSTVHSIGHDILSLTRIEHERRLSMAENIFFQNLVLKNKESMMKNRFITHQSQMIKEYSQNFMLQSQDQLKDLLMKSFLERRRIRLIDEKNSGGTKKPKDSFLPIPKPIKESKPSTSTVSNPVKKKRRKRLRRYGQIGPTPEKEILIPNVQVSRISAIAQRVNDQNTSVSPDLDDHMQNKFKPLGGIIQFTKYEKLSSKNKPVKRSAVQTVANIPFGLGTIDHQQNIKQAQSKLQLYQSPRIDAACIIQRAVRKYQFLKFLNQLNKTAIYLQSLVRRNHEMAQVPGIALKIFKESQKNIEYRNGVSAIEHYSGFSSSSIDTEKSPKKIPSEKSQIEIEWTNDFEAWMPQFVKDEIIGLDNNNNSNINSTSNVKSMLKAGKDSKFETSTSTTR